MALTEASSLDGLCQQVLGPDGALSRAIPGFLARRAQIDLALAIANAIEQQSTLVAEAGTGIGKTFAYLVPSLLSGKKVVISTATKTLQDQLFQKDLPTLVRALGLSARVQNLKGRANYLCRHRIESHQQQGARFLTTQVHHELATIREKLPRLTRGERSELPEIMEDSLVWPLVTSTRDNCLGSECPQVQQCFLIKARRRAMDANVVVINHHLYFADLRLKEEGLGDLLPKTGVIIFDEAHQLPDIAMQFYAEHFSSRQLRELFDDALREWPILDLAEQPLKQLDQQLDDLLWQLMNAVPIEERFSFDRIVQRADFLGVWQALVAFNETWLDCFKTIDFNVHVGLLRCKERLQQLQFFMQHLLDKKTTHILWGERYKRHVIFHRTPLDMAPQLMTQWTSHEGAKIFTSATLSVAQQMTHFLQTMGMNTAKTLCVPSPFDYQRQTLLYLPRGMPDPQHPSYIDGLMNAAVPVINALGGRCFFLFTSHKALKEAAARLSQLITFPLLIQGEEAKPILLERFRQLGHAVLLGTATFWEGVDVKGAALSGVIIDKLPFASHTDPVIHGKMAYLKTRGRSGFNDMLLPAAILALKQGVGRLIRDVTDQGVLMIADPRLTGRQYAQAILHSLPKMRMTRDPAVVQHFINQLALNDEATCN